MNNDFNNFNNYNNNNNYNNYNNYYTPNNSTINPSIAQQYFQEQQLLKKRDDEKRAIIKTGVVLGAAILAYLFIQTVIVMALARTQYYQVYKTSSTFQSCFNIVAVHMSSMLIPFLLAVVICKKNLIGPLIPLKKLGFLKTAAWTSFGMGICLASNLVTAFVISLFKQFGYELKTPEILKVDSPLACVALVVSTAVVPALFEEFAFRCCALGILQKYGKGFAVIAVSIVFGLVHGNIIQFVFTFLVGMILGYITIKTDSVLPAILVHGFNNGLSVFQDILKYAAGKSVSDDAVTAVWVIWVALAIASLIYLVVKKDITGLQPRQPNDPYALSLPAKLACLIPGLILPAIILIVLSGQFITKTGA